MARLVVHPVTPARWDDFAKLFEAKGAPHYCWCAPYRFADAHTMDKAEKRAAMRQLVKRGTPIGLLAYKDGEPVGWVSAAPRMTFAKLERSKVMPVVDETAWTVSCFFVAREHRDEGVPVALLNAAVKEARAKGATSIEGYPWDASGMSSTNLGRSAVFKKAGFKPDEGRRWARRLRASPRGSHSPA